MLPKKTGRALPYYAIAAIILYTIIVWQIATLGNSESWKVFVGGISGQEGSCVQKRLEEANDNWLRGLEAREKLEATAPLDNVNQWSWLHGVSFWDFFYPTFDCPHTVERIGRSGDGGKWICGTNHIAKKPSPCIVYSYGVNYETSFEEMMLDRTHCSVYMFDHTIEVENVTMLKKYKGRAFIEKIGLLDKETPNKYRTLKGQMEKNGHDFIDILKIDIEGYEIQVFQHMKEDFPLGLPFGQLSIELHVPSKPMADFYKTYKTWMVNLETMGLRAFRSEINSLGTIRGNPILCEYSFINVKMDNWLLNSDSNSNSNNSQ